MDVRHAETVDARRLVRQRFITRVEPQIDNVADAESVDLGQLRFGRLAGCRYPIVKTTPVIDRFRVARGLYSNSPPAPDDWAAIAIDATQSVQFARSGLGGDEDCNLDDYIGSRGYGTGRATRSAEITVYRGDPAERIVVSCDYR